MMAVGGLIGAAAPLFAGSALFGPMGVVAVSFIIGGAILVARLSNTSFEDWLAGSIFSKEEGFTNSEPSQTNSMFWEGSSHLEDPDEALYRLLGLLTGVSVNLTNVVGKVGYRGRQRSALVEIYTIGVVENVDTETMMTHATARSLGILTRDTKRERVLCFVL